MKTINRIACPHCGRAIAVRRDTGRICRHGPHRRPPCPGTAVEPTVNGALTEYQMDFARYCYAVGDALPIARLFGIEYPQPALDGIEPDQLIEALTNAARQWIQTTVMAHQEDQ